MAEALKATVYFAEEVRQSDTFAQTGGNPSESVEVVLLPEYERAVDASIDGERWHKAELRGLVRLAGGSEGESPLAVVTRLIEEVEHYRRMRADSPVLSDTSVAVLDYVPPAGEGRGMDLWEKVGIAQIPATAEEVAVIRHPEGSGGFVHFVTGDAWERYEDARRCHT
jgi:hypothetical protein